MQSAAKAACHRQREHQARKGKKDIGDPHEKSVREIAAPATENAHGCAHNGNHRHQQQRGKHTGSASGYHPGKHVSPITVCAQKMKGTGCCLNIA